MRWRLKEKFLFLRESERENKVRLEIKEVREWIMGLEVGQLYNEW